MNTNSLKPLGARGVLVAGAAVALFASVVMFAYADTAPSVTTTAYNSSNAAVSSAAIGSSVYAGAVVASSSTSTLPTGTVTFNRYADTSCSGTATTQDVALVNGAASSSLMSEPAAGLSYTVRYNGDSLNAAAISSCVAIAPMGSSTALNTVLSHTSITAGSTASETSTLANATANAGGSVSYVVYSDLGCTTAWQGAGVRTVSSGAVPASDSVLFDSAGTYYWKAVYSGDANNSAATSSCLALTVAATSTTANPGNASISGKVYNDANKNGALDSGEQGLAGFTVNLYKGAGWWGKNGLNNPIQTVVTDANGTYAFTNLADGVYSIEQIDQKGWDQTSSDYRKVTISNGVSIADENFANVAIATGTDKGGHGDDNGSSSGNHFGWFNFRGWGFGWFGNNGKNK